MNINITNFSKINSDVEILAKPINVSTDLDPEKVSDFLDGSNCDAITNVVNRMEKHQQQYQEDVKNEISSCE